MNDHKNSSIRRRGKQDCCECRKTTWEVFVLVIDAKKMAEDGHKFFLGRNSV